MSKAGSKGMAGMAVAIPNCCEVRYSTGPSSKGLATSGKNHFHEMNGDVGMAGWK